MKQIFILLQIMIWAACAKEKPCEGEILRCTHTIYYAYVACPDPEDPEQWVFSNSRFYTKSEAIPACDTSAWLEEARAFDERRKNDPNNDTWNQFARLYPNECGCN